MTPYEQRPNSLRARIAKRIAGSAWPTPPEETTAGGMSDQVLEGLMQPFFQISTKRSDVYQDVEQMDETVDEVATALDMLADNAVSGEGETFSIAYVGEVAGSTQEAIEKLLERTQWREKGYEIARDCLKYGDEFRQVVWDGEGNIVRMMHMPADSMKRNEDEVGLLLRGSEQSEWAFEQYKPRTNQFIAGFYPWEMCHMRWNKTGGSAYGRSLVYTARTSWRKLQAMEEALVINWITRAFARLLFTLDVTGKSPKEAQKAIHDFKRSLQTRRIAKDVEGVEQLSVVKDIFIGRSYLEIGGRAQPGLTDAKVLDTSSTGYMQLGPIDYYRSKILMDLRTPKAYLGLEEDVNAKATLVQEDRRYARFLRRIQDVLSYGISFTIDLQLAAYGIEVPQYTVHWPTPSWSDVVEDSEAMLNYARAAEVFLPIGAIDVPYISRKWLRMSQAERDKIERTEMPDDGD
jgi:hypothetical protein